MNENRNLFIALFLCMVVLLAWPYFFPAPQSGNVGKAPQSAQYGYDKDSFSPGAPATLRKSDGADKKANSERYAKAPRVQIRTPELVGSFSLLGARLDDLSLKNYRVGETKNSPMVRLFYPLPDRVTPALKNASNKSDDFYFSEFGWLTVEGDVNTKIPDQNTLWRLETDENAPQARKQGPAAEGSFIDTLTPAHPISLAWDNGAGLVFHRTLSVDDHYLFTVEDSIDNKSGKPLALYAYSLAVRQIPQETGSRILHEGMIGVFKDKGLKEIKYDTLKKDGSQTISNTEGWVGITDKYWACALVPPQQQPITAQFKNRPGTEAVQADYLSSALEVAPNSSLSFTHRVFTGAKVVSLINTYQNSGIYRFDLLVDWGWFSFLTKPVFYMIDFIGQMTGNFGLAILLMTVLIKAVFYPLANKSYASMNKMRELQPEIERIRSVTKGDAVKQQQAIVALYKKEGVSPLSGCLPMLIQIPVFFALYKVLYGTIEMRHAPFFGWIHDLSAPDPTTIFNLFGLISWMPPSYLMIGAWPLLMGATMFLQQRLTPGPSDPLQQKVFMWLPVLFTFMLAQFPAGLVIYWTWNNALSVAQQLWISKRQARGPMRAVAPAGKK